MKTRTAQNSAQHLSRFVVMDHITRMFRLLYCFKSAVVSYYYYAHWLKACQTNRYYGVYV